jgi:hypothetical protein
VFIFLTVVVPARVTGKDVEDLLPGADSFEAGAARRSTKFPRHLAMDEQKWALFLPRNSVEPKGQVKYPTCQAENCSTMHRAQFRTGANQRSPFLAEPAAISK